MKDLEADRQRGVNARLLLETPLLVEAFETTKDEYVKAWRDAPARDTEGRERLWMMVKLLDKVKAHLETVMSGGQLAERELTDLQERRKWRVFG